MATFEISKYQKEMLSFFRSKLANVDERIENVLIPLQAERVEILAIIEELEKGDKASHSRVQLTPSTPPLPIIERVAQTARYNWMTVGEIAQKLGEGFTPKEMTALKGNLSAVLAMESKRPEEKQRVSRRKNPDGSFAYRAKNKPLEAA